MDPRGEENDKADFFVCLWGAEEGGSVQLFSPWANGDRVHPASSPGRRSTPPQPGLLTPASGKVGGSRDKRAFRSNH